MASDRSFARLRGFRDFAPDDLSLRSHIFSAWRRVSRSYGFAEYDGPPLEPLDLYVVKSGEEIAKQIYAFSDKGGREVAMRPEMTPSLARILAARSRQMPKPIRWFSIPQLFRYERSQRGRLREHFQLNVDIVGEAGVAADAEVLALAIDAVRALGLTDADFVARVNDRRLFHHALAALGVEPECREACTAVIDRAGRTSASDRAAAFAAAGVAAGAARVLERLVERRSLADVGRAFPGNARIQAAMEPVQTLSSTLDTMGLGDYVEYDFTIVRGLDYYTGIVFELFDRGGRMRAICGGGRYDRLLELVGGEPLPAVGFGMGDVVLGELVGDLGLAPDAAPACDDFVAWVTPAERGAALGAARQLREAGRSVQYALRQQALGKQLRQAARAGAARAVIIGPDEAAAGAATVRDLATGDQRTVAVRALAADAHSGEPADPARPDPAPA